MVQTIFADENRPYPNNALPILYYENVLNEVIGDSYSPQDVLELFENNGYTNGWKGGVLSDHHFHSNTHEVLAVVEGEAQVQLGGPNGKLYKVREGDVMLLPAGITHKKVDGTQKFTVAGAYPDGLQYDMQYGDASDYEAIRERINNVPIPVTDPVYGSPGGVREFWKS